MHPPARAGLVGEQDGRGEGMVPEVLGVMQEVKPQWRQALDNANQIRLVRTKIKRQMASGEKQIWEILEDLPEALNTMTVYELVMAMPRYGKHRAGKTMMVLRISQSKTCGALTERQRKEAARYFRYIKGNYTGLD